MMIMLELAVDTSGKGFFVTAGQKGAKVVIKPCIHPIPY